MQHDGKGGDHRLHDHKEQQGVASDMQTEARDARWLRLHVDHLVPPTPLLPSPPREGRTEAHVRRAGARSMRERRPRPMAGGWPPAAGAGRTGPRARAGTGERAADTGGAHAERAWAAHNPRGGR